jgi:hypothetical protein
MDNFLVGLLPKILTILGISIALSWIMKTNKRDSRTNSKKGHIVMHLPREFRWVGLADVILFSFFIMLMYCFPNIMTGGDEKWPALIFGIFILAGLLIIVATNNWRIDIFPKEEYFFIKTYLGMSYTIKFSDIISYEGASDVDIIIKTSIRKFSINKTTESIEIFENMLLQHKVPFKFSQKDCFNGNIKNPKGLFTDLCFLGVIFSGIGICFLWSAFFGICDSDTRVFLKILSVLTFVFSIGSPIVIIYVVRNRKKYPLLAKRLINPNQFVDK